MGQLVQQQLTWLNSAPRAKTKNQKWDNFKLISIPILLIKLKLKKQQIGLTYAQVLV